MLGGPSVFTDNYFRFGNSVLCGTAPAAMGEVGPFVSGRIYYNDSYFIQPDLCATPQILDFNAISSVHFNKEIFLVSGLVYEFHKDPPLLLSQVRYHQAHCRALDTGTALDTGFVANVIQRGGQYFAEVLRGVDTGTGFLRFKVDEFPVTRSDVTGGGVSYRANGFSLTIQGSGPGSTGSLQLNWSGETVNRSSICW